jgi:hypothetical protein
MAAHDADVFLRLFSSRLRYRAKILLLLAIQLIEDFGESSVDQSLAVIEEKSPIAFNCRVLLPLISEVSSAILGKGRGS